jgi:hypothetical protein
MCGSTCRYGSPSIPCDVTLFHTLRTVLHIHTHLLIHAVYFIQEDFCADNETFHFQEQVTLLVMSTSTSDCGGSEDPVVGYYTVQPTLSPTHSPTVQPSHAPTTAAPTSYEFGKQQKKNKQKAEEDATGLLLAIILPIVIVAVIAIVGVGARAYFVTGAAGMTALADSDHSGNNLVFDS